MLFFFLFLSLYIIIIITHHITQHIHTYTFTHIYYILPSFLTYFLYASRYDFLSPISIKPDSILNPFTILFCSRAFLTASSIPKALDIGISVRNFGSIT